mgnify:CR=1 FL=1
MIKFVKRKSMQIRESFRSSDYITPSFDFGCLAECSYCYLKRHKPKGVDVAKNYEDILNAVIKHHSNLGNKIPNQTHKDYWTYDIGCNHDVALHWKYQPYPYIFDTFTLHGIFPTFATKFVNKKLLEYQANNNVRIRFSLMPQEYSTLLEPNTSLIIDRIKAINTFKERGWDVHVNFSPVIVVPGALELYENLFKMLSEIVEDKYKPEVKAEVIFLTHNKEKHQYNLENNLPGEDLIWNPEIQRVKKSQYGGVNLRYEPNLKKQLITEFTQSLKAFAPWCEIRYIF